MNNRWTYSNTTVFNLSYHLIWTPKYRRKVLVGAIQERLRELLEDYTKRFGHEKLCSQLGYMQFQIWRAVREINGERDSQDGEKYASCTNAT